MSAYLVINMRHYLGEHLEFIEIPGPAVRLRDFIGSIIAAVTACPPTDVNRGTNVKCRHIRKCKGEIIGHIDTKNTEEIHWFCDSCQEQGIITGWEQTHWNKIKAS